MVHAESEKIILGSWMLGYNRQHVQEFNEEDFPCCGHVCRAIQELQKGRHRIEPVEVASKSGVPIAEIMEMTSLYQPGFYDGAYRQVKLHRIRGIAEEIAKGGNVEKQAGRLLLEMDRLDVERVEPPSDFIQDFIMEMDRRAKREPLKYGLGNLDKVTGGIRPQELTTLAARPSVGKSAMALQIAIFASGTD